MDQNPPGEQPPVNPDRAFSTQLPPPTGGVPPIPPGRFGPQPGATPPPGNWDQMPPMPPAPVYVAPPAPRHTFVRGIFVTLATTIFGFSLILNLYLLLISGVLSGSSTTRVETVREGDAAQRIAVVPLNGVLMDDQYRKFDRILKQAEEDGLKALLVEIDTPGGSVTASDMIYNRLLKFRKEHPGVPVTASMGSMATSGGYYAACGADHIVAQRTTMTGNIGVLMPRYNLSELAKRIGVSETTIESTGAPFKNAGSMFKPEDPAETDYFRGIIDDAFKQFKAVVTEGRTGRLKMNVDDIANGKVYTAAQAMEMGLIDQVGYLDDAIDHVASAAGLAKPNVVRYDEMSSLADMFLGSKTQGVSDRGVKVEISPEVIDRFTTPRLMYLWRAE